MEQQQLTFINPIDLQPGHSVSTPAYDPAWAKDNSPRTSPSEGTYTTPSAQAQATTLQVGDTVEVLPFTDPWGFKRGQFEKATITHINGDRITLSIPGIVTRDGYQCDISRIRKI
jgi:hypothetical protein